MRSNVLALLLLSTASYAQSPQPSGEFKPALGKLIRANCHMGVCTWLSLQVVQLVGKSERGELYAVAERMWSSYHPDGHYNRQAPRKDERIYQGFVFCSKSTPAIFDYYSDGLSDTGPKSWRMGALKPGREDAVYGYTITGYVEYMAVCHNNTDPDLAINAQFGQRLGYHFVDGELNDHKVASPFDILR